MGNLSGMRIDADTKCIVVWDRNDSGREHAIWIQRKQFDRLRLLMNMEEYPAAQPTQPEAAKHYDPALAMAFDTVEAPAAQPEAALSDEHIEGLAKRAEERIKGSPSKWIAPYIEAAIRDALRAAQPEAASAEQAWEQYEKFHADPRWEPDVLFGGKPMSNPVSWGSLASEREFKRLFNEAAQPVLEPCPNCGKADYVNIYCANHIILTRIIGGTKQRPGNAALIEAANYWRQLHYMHPDPSEEDCDRACEQLRKSIEEFERTAQPEAKREALDKILREHNYFYHEPTESERHLGKAGFYYCLCGWEGPDRSSYWKHLPPAAAPLPEQASEKK